MPWPVAAMVTGAASLGAAFLGNRGNSQAAGLSRKGIKRQNRENLRESKRNRKFQKRMSNTSIRRSMKDMRKAGLNPMLAYGQAGASQPGGATANVQSEETNTTSSAASGVQAGLTAFTKFQEHKLLTNQNKIAVAQQAEIAARTGTAVATKQQVEANTRLIKLSEPKAMREADLFSGPLGEVTTTKQQGGTAMSVWQWGKKKLNQLDRKIDAINAEAARRARKRQNPGRVETPTQY